MATSRRGGARKLRPWLVAQLESGRFPGLTWDDAARSALRIPWQHAGKGGARGGVGAALCQAWAEFKGRAQGDPAGCKTRLRCALSKSPEFQELPQRSRLQGPHPYKVYRLLPHPDPSGAAPAGGAQPRKAPAPPTQEAPPPEEPRPLEEEPAPPLQLSIQVDSAKPLPPAQGGACLGVSIWWGGALACRDWFPPGEYVLQAPPLAEATPLAELLPRLLLKPRPPEGAWLGAGLLVGSTRRGLFLRRKGRGQEGAGPHLHAPHGGPTALPEGRLVHAFDAQRFRREVGQHLQGLCPRPEHRVTLSSGPDPPPHALILQLEQAFAQPLLDAASSKNAAINSQ